MWGKIHGYNMDIDGEELPVPLLFWNMLVAVECMICMAI
jgi:hypothetical protein